MKNLRLHYDKRLNRLELIHPLLGTIMVIDCQNILQAERAMKGWAKGEADCMLIKGYSVEHTEDFNQ